MKVLYKCNGNIPTCDKTNCIYKGGFCDCTSDIRYAKNFVKAVRGNDVLYVETTDDEIIKIPAKLLNEALVKYLADHDLHD